MSFENPVNAPAKRPPPIPRDAARHQPQPPPLPTEVLRKKGVEPQVEEALTWTRANQKEKVVPAFRIPGFDRLDAVMSMEKKNDQKPEAFNEDSALVFDPKDPRGCLKLAGVLADGAGGEAQGPGDLASEAAVQNAEPLLKKSLAQALTLTTQDAERKILAHQEKKHGGVIPEVGLPYINEMLPMAMGEDPRIANSAWAAIEAVKQTQKFVVESGGKTTENLFLIHETPSGARYAIVASVGDSPAYVRARDGSIRQITTEDSLLRHLQQKKLITQDDLDQIKADPSLTITVSGQKMSYSQLRATMVGGLGRDDEQAEPSLAIVRLEPGEALLVTSDAMDKLENKYTDSTDTEVVQHVLAQGKSSIEQLDLLRQVIKNPKLLGKTAERLAAYKSEDDFSGVLITAQ